MTALLTKMKTSTSVSKPLFHHPLQLLTLHLPLKRRMITWQYSSVKSFTRLKLRSPHGLRSRKCVILMMNRLDGDLLPLSFSANTMCVRIIDETVIWSSCRSIYSKIRHETMETIMKNKVFIIHIIHYFSKDPNSSINKIHRFPRLVSILIQITSLNKLN